MFSLCRLAGIVIATLPLLAEMQKQVEIAKTRAGTGRAEQQSFVVVLESTAGNC